MNNTVKNYAFEPFDTSIPEVKLDFSLPNTPNPTNNLPFAANNMISTQGNGVGSGVNLDWGNSDLGFGQTTTAGNVTPNQPGILSRLGSWLGGNGNATLTPTLAQQNLIDTGYANHYKLNAEGTDGFLTKTDYTNRWLAEQGNQGGWNGKDTANALMAGTQFLVNGYFANENLKGQKEDRNFLKQKYEDYRTDRETRSKNIAKHAQEGIDAYNSSRKVTG